MARQTNAQLIARLREVANLETFSTGLGRAGQTERPTSGEVRAATRLYRDTWLAPVLDEIERRLVKPRRRASAPATHAKVEQL